MRVFTAVRHSNDPVRFYGGLWSANFYPALLQLGHEIVESQTDLLATSRFMNVATEFTRQETEVRAQTTERILSEVREAHQERPVDLFLSYFYNAHFDPAGFDVLRRLGIPSVNFYCNSIYQFPLVAAVASKVDYSWHAERDARADYRAVGATPIWVQMGADPQVYRPVEGGPRRQTACFVGQRYADRALWTAALIRAGVPVEIYGPGWGASSGTELTAVSGREDSYLGRTLHSPGSFSSYAKVLSETLRAEGVAGGIRRVLDQIAQQRESARLVPLLSPFAKGAVPFQRIAEVFSSTAVCLNFSNVWADGRPGSRLVPHVRLRDFEAPMSRTCYLTGHTEEIAEFFEIGSEVDTYRTPDELVDKARYYLAHPAAAERLRAAGYGRAMRDHTWVRRFEQLFSLLGDVLPMQTLHH